MISNWLYKKLYIRLWTVPDWYQCYNASIHLFKVHWWFGQILTRNSYSSNEYHYCERWMSIQGWNFLHISLRVFTFPSWYYYVYCMSGVMCPSLVWHSKPSVNTCSMAQESKIVEIQLPSLFVFANKQGSEKINCFLSQFLSWIYGFGCNNNFTSGY